MHRTTIESHIVASARVCVASGVHGIRHYGGWEAREMGQIFYTPRRLCSTTQDALRHIHCGSGVTPAYEALGYGWLVDWVCRLPTLPVANQHLEVDTDARFASTIMFECLNLNATHLALYLILARGSDFLR
ncbi:hypothetical protein V2G26_017009 [Clonostachys chloroleuca]